MSPADIHTPPASPAAHPAIQPAAPAVPAHGAAHVDLNSHNKSADISNKGMVVESKSAPAAAVQHHTPINNHLKVEVNQQEKAQAAENKVQAAEVAIRNNLDTAANAVQEAKNKLRELERNENVVAHATGLSTAKTGDMICAPTMHVNSAPTTDLNKLTSVMSNAAPHLKTTSV